MTKNKLQVRLGCPQCGAVFTGSSSTRSGDKCVSVLAHTFLSLHSPPCRFMEQS